MEFISSGIGKVLLSVLGAIIGAAVLYFKGRSDGMSKGEKIVLENDAKAQEAVVKKVKDDNEKISRVTTLFERIRRLRRKP